MRPTTSISILGLFLCAATAFACGGSGDGTVTDNGPQGGSSGSGQGGTGGAAQSGGAAGTGGVAVTGGQAGTGGTAQSGGAAGTGGVVATGGQAGTGGTAGAGGTGGTGGIGVTGGTGGIGGTPNDGGTDGAPPNDGGTDGAPPKDGGTDAAPPTDASSATCPTPANRPINGDPCADTTLTCDYAGTSGAQPRTCKCLPAGGGAEWLCYNTPPDGGVPGGGACPATKPAVGDACTDATLGCPYFTNPPHYCTCRVQGGATTPTWGGGTC